MRKNIVEKKLFFVICLIFSVLCFSCNNVLFQDINSINKNPDLQNADNERQIKYGKISGEVTFNGALPQEILRISGLDAVLNKSSRTAFPSMTELTSSPDNYEYNVFARKTSDSSKISDGTYNKTLQSFEIQNIPQNVEFEVIVQLVQSGDIDPILEGVSKKVTITESNPVMSLSGEDRIKLKPSGKGQGNVDLNIEMEAGMAPQVQYVTVVSSGASFSAAVQYNATNVEIKNNETSIPAGAYDITVNFYNNSSDCVLLYSYSDVINVYNSFTTDTWTLNNDVSGLLYEDTSGASPVVKAKLTNDLLEQFLKTTFYVDQEAPEGGNGSYYDPCNTIQKVLETITKYNQQNQNYRIYVKAGYQETVLSQHDFKNFNCVMEPYQDAIGDRKGTITLNAGNSDSLKDAHVIYIEDGIVSFYNLIIDGMNIEYGSDNEAPSLIYACKDDGATNLTLTDCTLCNAKNTGLYLQQYIEASLVRCSISGCSSDWGGGIYETFNTTCTLTDCKIFSNSSENSGGGIFGGGELIFDGNCVIGDQTFSSTATSTSYSNYAKYGAGIYSNGIITVKPGAKLYVCGNYAEQEGGGIYIETDTNFSISDTICSYNGAEQTGGGVRLSVMQDNKKINFDSLSIKNCKAGQNGGGLYIQMNNTNSGYATTLNKSIVSDCSAQEDGGGVYIEKGAVVLTDTQVYSCSAFNNGGGVFAGSLLYVRDGSAIGINKDGVDYQNSAGENGKGNGVYVAYSSSPALEGKLYLNGTGYVYSKNDVYLCDNNVTSVKLICESDLNPASPDKIAAMITLQTYAADKEVLQQESEAQVGYRKNSYIYFKITQDDWSLDESGKLIPLFYVSVDGSYEDASGTKAKPYKTLSYAISQHSEATKIKFIVNGHIYDSDITVGFGKTYLIEGANFDNTKDIIDGENASGESQGLIINYGNFVINNITLQNGKNYGTGLLCISYAGGITNAGTCMLDCCRIIDCESTGDIQYGGAIYSDTTGGKLTLKNCIIGQEGDPNKAAQGAGIYLHSPVEFIGKNYICYNEATAGDADPYYAGGGIFYNMDGITSDQELKDVEISNNAGVNGAGICVTGGSSQIKITDCVIKDNIGQTDKDYAETPLSLCGSGVYVDGNVSLAGKNYFASNNDIYVKSGKPVTITGPLDLPQEAGGVAGVITPEDYTKQVIDGTAYRNNYSLFKISNDSEGARYHIQPDGYLAKEIDLFTSNIDSFILEQNTYVLFHGDLTQEQFDLLKTKIENGKEYKIGMDFTNTASNDIENMDFNWTKSGNNKICEVIFPNYISDFSFLYCGDLMIVKFAEDSILTTLKTNSFWECYNISVVELPDSVRQVQKLAFSGTNVTGSGGNNTKGKFNNASECIFLKGSWGANLTGDSNYNVYSCSGKMEDITLNTYLNVDKLTGIYAGQWGSGSNNFPLSHNDCNKK